MPQLLPTYRFGPYELRTQSRELFKLGTKLRLRPQSYQVLELLLQRAGDAVSREELHHALWPDSVVTDFELGLNTCIKELRGLLSDSATEPRYIQTLPKIGYRMIRTVTIQPDSADTTDQPGVKPSPTFAETSAGPAMDRRVPPASARWRKWSALAAALVLIVGASGYWRWSRHLARTPAAPARTMLAVLPFENLTGDPTQDYFSDGLTEEMITQLGRLDPQHLGLIARSSAMHYKSDHKNLQEISKELGVQYVLEGSVRRDAGKVRITAELLQTSNQTHLWSQEYDRELSSLLAVQSEIAQEIAREIKVTLRENASAAYATPAATAPLSPQRYQAYDLYLEGRYFWNKRTPESLQRAADYFQQSIAKDPTYARSYAGLADTYSLMTGYNGIAPATLMPKARAAAQTAVQLDDHSAEAHVSLAVIAQNYDWDWSTAEKEYRRAIALDPNYATAHHWYAEYLALLGRFDEASTEIERARQLDPLSLIIAADRGAILYFSRQYDAAIAQFRSVLEMEPNFPRAQIIIYAYVQQKKYPEALAAMEKYRIVFHSPWIPALSVYVYANAGQQDAAKQAMSALNAPGWMQQAPLPTAVAYIGLGKNDEAFHWLNVAIDQHSTSLTALKIDPTYDPLRSDPRFTQLLHRMNLQP